MVQQTAIDWLVKEFNLEEYMAAVEFAKAKEKEQIIEAYNKGNMSSELANIYAEKYYIKTYNK